MCHTMDVESKVMRTSLFVALFRSCESVLHPHDCLFEDPYAQALAGTVEEKEVIQSVDPSNIHSLGWFVSLTAIRTRKIDDYINETVSQSPVRQICVLGAGVDARPWRLQTQLNDQSQIKYYEVDYPEIFHYKLPILKSQGAKALFDYQAVEADLSLPTWMEHLEAAGFDHNAPTLWVLEGLTGYLTEEALHVLLERITVLSAPQSCMVATFLTPPALAHTLRLHRFAPEDPLSLVSGYGWIGEQVDMEDHGVALGRGSAPGEATRGYYLVTVQKHT